MIAAGHTKPGANSGISLDRNPSHWTIGAAYIGQITQGRAVTTSRWYGFGLTSWPGGTFCNGNYAIQWSCTAGRPVGPGWVDQGNGCYHRNSGNACSL